MGAISAVRHSLGAIARNPILIAVALLIGIAQLPQLLVQSVNSAAVVAASGILSLVFVLFYPFFFGGIIGMGNEALDGNTRLGTFVSAGKANYVSLFGGYIILIGIFVLYFIALAIIGIGGAALVSTGGNATAGAAFIGFALVSILVYFVIFFFVQFFGQAIVLDDVGAVDGSSEALERSADTSSARSATRSLSP